MGSAQNSQSIQILGLKKQLKACEGDLSSTRQSLSQAEVRIRDLERALEKAKLEKMTDDLTGLKTKVAFIDEVKHHFNILVRAERHVREGILPNANEQEFSVMFLDLNGFKSINDTHGHGAGDAVLVNFAAFCEAHFRAGDVVARHSGDEFLVLLTGVTPKEKAERIKEKFLAALEGFEVQITDNDGNEKIVSIGCSVGVASTSEGFKTFEEMKAAADADMYAHKKASKVER